MDFTTHLPAGDAWAALLTPACEAAGIPPAYARRWIEIESAYNPCAVGHPAAHGPDGYPRELGLGQLYNPDDLARAGLTGARMRAYCAPGDQHEVTYKGRVIRGFSSAAVRALTDDEQRAQVDGFVKLIKHCMTTATVDLQRVSAAGLWHRKTLSYWTLVKLQHGLPGISRSGLPAVQRYLGRAPQNWSEFRSCLSRVQLDAETMKYRAEFPAVLDNAERCAAAFSEGAA